MKFFIDVDNTILEHSGFYSIETESRIHSSIGKFPLENENAIKIMYESAICRNPDIVKRLIQQDNVYILTKYPAIEYEIHKQQRVAEILGITHDELMSMTDKNGIKKYICLISTASKVNTVKEIFKLDDLKDCILVDDYSSNLIEWENNQGIAIKYYNEYNSPNHPVKGISISNFKIFSQMLDNNQISDLMISCEDTYMLNLFISLLKKKMNCNYLDILNEVYYDLKSKLSLEKMDINSKYNLRNFLIEYYNLQSNLNNSYWNSLFNQKIVADPSIKLICASFDTDLKNLKVFDDENNLALKIIEPNKSKTTNIYDVYLTLDSNAFLAKIDSTLDDLINSLSIFLFGGND